MTNSLLIPYVIGLVIVRLIRWAINALLSAIACLIGLVPVVIVAGLAVAATVSLGPRFEIVMVVVVLLIVLFLVAIRLRGKPRRIRDPYVWHKRRMRKQMFPWIALFAMCTIVLLIAGVQISNRITDQRARPQDAEAALESFAAEYAPDVDQARLERTLAEFERIRRDLAKQWLTPDSNPRLHLYLFQDAYDYRAYTSGKKIIEWSSGYVSCSEDGVLIFVPLEEASNVFDESPISSTPTHEMVHATWCQKLGAGTFWSIPRWFHEGMAQRYGNEGMKQLYEKLTTRWWVWFNRNDLLSSTQFCGYQLQGNRTEIGLFYGTSWEFIRSLEARHGIQSLNAIVDDVGAGTDFEDSLRDRLGGKCNELYSEWSESLRAFSIASAVLDSRFRGNDGGMRSED